MRDIDGRFDNIHGDEDEIREEHRQWYAACELQLVEMMELDEELWKGKEAANQESWYGNKK